MNVSQLVSPADKQAHKEILAALGSENNPRQWMIFMQAVDKHIPEMQTQGRLSADTIKHSLIGKLGFNSWKEYIESSTENGGLGWSIGGWNSFRRAWTIVKEHDYLLEMDVKAGWVNSFAAKLSAKDQAFPSSQAELEEIQQRLDVDRAQGKATELEKLREKALKSEGLESACQLQLEKIADLAAQVKDLEQKLDTQKKLTPRKPKPLSRLEHLWMAISGN